jgi:hypothetical protein
VVYLISNSSFFFRFETTFAFFFADFGLDVGACESELSSTFLFVTFVVVFFLLLFRFLDTGVSYPSSFLVAGGGGGGVNPTFLVLVFAQVYCSGERVGAGVNTKAAGKLEGASKVE